MRRRGPTTTVDVARTWQVGHYDGPATDDARLRMAKFLATGIVPPIYRRNPGACLTLLLKAQALDIPVSTALENLHWNEAIGKGSLTAQLMAALLLRHHFQFKVTEETADRVRMTFYKIVDGRRRKLGDVEWTILEAVGAGLTWRDQWRHYPTDMLWARCLMRGARRHASEVGTGLAYTIEELADMGEPTDGSELDRAVQNILERATGDATADFIRGVLVKEAKAKKLLELDTGDGSTLGYVLGMLWGAARAREVDQLAASNPEPDAADPTPAGAGLLACQCPADQVLRTGSHVAGLHRDPAPVGA